MKPIEIVGGGLAGLSLGIALRQAGAPVAVIEAGHYPRHRVCGEFVSGRGRRALKELGLGKKLEARGAKEARTAMFCSPRGVGTARELPEPALCVSRFELDACLAEEFRRLGGELKENERWNGEFGEGVARATGRRVAAAGKWRWFALKAHARGVRLEADLEMHVFENAYVGVCRLNDEVANVCGLFRSRAAVPDLRLHWREHLSGPPGSRLNARMRGAEFLEETFCSTAGLDLEPQRAMERRGFCVGDAITMIAPLTGNGMSMALEAAQLSCPHLLDYSRGTTAWGEAARRAAQACDERFRRRLFWGARLQEAAFGRWRGEPAVWLGEACPALWRRLFAWTR